MKISQKLKEYKEKKVFGNLIKFDLVEKEKRNTKVMSVFGGVAKSRILLDCVITNIVKRKENLFNK